MALFPSVFQLIRPHEAPAGRDRLRQIPVMPIGQRLPHRKRAGEIEMKSWRKHPKVYHRDGPGSMSLLEEATNPTEVPIIFHPRVAICLHPRVKGMTLMVNSIYNGSRFEDILAGSIGRLGSRWNGRELGASAIRKSPTNGP